MTMATCCANYELASLATHNHNFAHGQTTLISHQLPQQQQQVYHHHHQLLNHNHNQHHQHHHHNHQQQQMYADGRRHHHQHHQQQPQQEHLSHNHHSHHYSEQNQENPSQYSRQHCQPQLTSSLLSTTSVPGGTITRNAHTSILPSIRATQHAITHGKSSNQSDKNSNITSSHNSSVPALKPATNNVDSSSAEVSLCSLSISSSCKSASDANGVVSKDFNVPLHVDCSVEYELPNQPKPPAGQRVEPLLMIHPCYFRKIESQRRSPFVNNMPAAAIGRDPANVNSNSQTSLPSSNIRRSRQNQVMQQPHHNIHPRQLTVTTALYQQQHQQQQQYRHSYQQQKMSQMSQQAHYPTAVNLHHHSQKQQKQQNQTELAAVTVNTLTNNRIANQGSSHNQQERITQNANTQQQQQQHTLTQRQQQCSASAKWDQLTESAVAAASVLAMRSNISSNRMHYNTVNDNNDTIISGRFLSSSYNSTSDSNEFKALINTNVGKRDVMISGNGVYSGSGNECSKQHTHSHIQQQNSCMNIDNIWNRVSRNGTATAAIATSTGNAALIMDRSPTATVPSNYQAGPDTMPLLNQTATMAISKCNTSTVYGCTSANNTEQQQEKQHYQEVTSAVLTSHKHRDHQRYTDKLTGKYRQYLKSQRMHPYLTAGTTATATNLGQTFPQFTTTAAASFQQLQQISCYNV